MMFNTLMPFCIPFLPTKKKDRFHDPRDTIIQWQCNVFLPVYDVYACCAGNMADACHGLPFDDLLHDTWTADRNPSPCDFIRGAGRYNPASCLLQCPFAYCEYTEIVPVHNTHDCPDASLQAYNRHKHRNDGYRDPAFDSCGSICRKDHRVCAQGSRSWCCTGSTCHGVDELADNPQGSYTRGSSFACFWRHAYDHQSHRLFSYGRSHRRWRTR